MKLSQWIRFGLFRTNYKIFNSNLCLAYLVNLVLEKELPNPDRISLNDDAGKLCGMLNFCDAKSREEIVRMMLNKEPIVAELPYRMNLNSTNYLSKSQMVSLLYRLGYLTIDTETSLKKE